MAPTVEALQFPGPIDGLCRWASSFNGVHPQGLSLLLNSESTPEPHCGPRNFQLGLMDLSHSEPDVRASRPPVNVLMSLKNGAFIKSETGADTETPAGFMKRPPSKWAKQ